MNQNEIKEIIDEEFPNRVVSVEDDVVWVSSMNQDCRHVAETIAQELVSRHGVPCSLVYGEDMPIDGVQFRYGDNA